MYWPSTSIDAEYRYEISDNPWLDADEQLARYKNWRDSNEWPVSSRKTEIMRRLAKKQGDPLEKPGVVGAFNRVYSIEDAIAQFLPEVYEPSATENRYDYIPADSSAGLVIYDNGKFAYSHHATDPVCGKLCSAFDLVRLHLFGDQDDAAAPGTPVNRLPSYAAMSELAIGDEAVRKSLTERRLKELSEAFDIKEDGAVKRWNAGEIPILPAHPASAGHGLNLQAGGHIVIWYNWTHNLEWYQQANKRLHRPGQKRIVLIHHICIKDGIDAQVLNNVLAEKANAQEYLIQALRAKIQEVTA